ncbi:hypothetical protein BD560DRAFT_428338 [Blakeslea trispora]|nr:hypothetical protein BD560DRAFT_428338 [Blakeslea trispora]
MSNNFKKLKRREQESLTVQKLVEPNPMTKSSMTKSRSDYDLPSCMLILLAGLRFQSKITENYTRKSKEIKVHRLHKSKRLLLLVVENENLHKNLRKKRKNSIRGFSTPSSTRNERGVSYRLGLFLAKNLLSAFAPASLLGAISIALYIAFLVPSRDVGAITRLCH